MLEKTVAFLVGPRLPFARSSLEYKHASMFVFAAFVTFLTFGSYIVENVMVGIYPLPAIEAAMFLVVLGAYLDFRRRYRIKQSMLLLIFAVSTVTICGLYFNSIEPYAILIWVAALPLFVFLLLGHKLGLHWSFVNVGGIVLVIAISTFYEYRPVFSIGFQLQALFGYLVVSAIAYYFENQRSTLELRLFETLKERETLFKEVHHRVKNNMQVMMGLLWLQSENIRDPDSSKILLANVDRLSAMAALHERLYRQKSMQRIDMCEYLETIVSHLQTLTTHAIVLECEPLYLDMHGAMQVGLITNEAVTNAQQHAFKTGEQGEIRIQFSQKDGRCTLRISDNGQGIPQTTVKESLGSLLIRDFAAALPESALQIDTLPSVTLTLTFAHGDDDAS